MEGLHHIVFEDADAASSCLQELLEMTGKDIVVPLTDALAEAPDPMKALVALVRFLERSGAASAEAALMVASPRYLRMLVALFSQGALLSDILCRNPEYGRWLWTDAMLDQTLTREDRAKHSIGAFATYPGFEARCAWMRRYSRRELLRIAARDVFVHAPFNAIVSDISGLADAMLEAACVAARASLDSRYSEPVSNEEPERPLTFCILAMGKLGGSELNFSSDIDLLFIYSDEGQCRTDTGATATTEEYFRKLSELIVKALSEQTSSGRVFRVDMRLRPFGKSGPLACTREGAIEYYSTYGRAWERQALIKARPCAGDLQLGETMLERLRSFVYPRYFDDATLEDIRNIKQQSEAATARKAHTEREVKLGRGGIRDIEFTVQILQLLHGGRWPDSRTPNTLEAVRVLGERQRLSPFEAKTLESNYIFLRQVEHRLQIEGGLQTHVLPENKQELNLLARRLGYESGEAFMNVYRERTCETRQILEQFLALKGDGNLWVIELLDRGATGGAGLEKLRHLGFAEPVRARQELLTLANGPEDLPYTRDTAQQFAAITPFLLDAVSQTPDPDATLLRFSRILGQLQAPATLYNLLGSNSRLTHYLATLIANSDYFAELIVRDISLLDLLGTPGFLDNASSRHQLEQELEALEQAADPAPALYRLRDGEILKVALRELTQDASVAAVGDELTLLADVIVDAALRDAAQRTRSRYGAFDAAYAVLAVGKFGGCEMGYGSDLDLIFVYDQAADDESDTAIAPTEYFGALASLMLKTLKEPTRYGILYDVDARLRPDGSKGALAITDQRLREYYREQAQFWERFALMKVRAVAGTPAFMAHLESMARDIAFALPPDNAALEQLESLRRQLAATASPYDLKRREGGIAEIEFATRLLQLRHVAEHPELKRGGVFVALALLSERNLIAEADSVCLRDAYLCFRQILNRARMMRGSTSARLPDNPDMLHRLRQCLGIQESLMERVEKHAERVHAVYQQIFDEIEI